MKMIFELSHPSCKLPLHTWQKLRFEDSFSFPVLYFQLLVLFSLLEAATERRLYSGNESATISRRPLLFLLHLPPRQLSSTTPPPSLAEWQYHLPHNRKRWTVNLGQSALKNMTHSCTMKTWQEVRTHIGPVCTQTQGKACSSCAI